MGARKQMNLGQCLILLFPGLATVAPLQGAYIGGQKKKKKEILRPGEPASECPPDPGLQGLQMHRWAMWVPKRLLLRKKKNLLIALAHLNSAFFRLPSAGQFYS
jgi:hypothetical protein